MFSRGGFLVDFLPSFEMIFEALGGQEQQKGSKMGHNGGDGRVLVAKAVLARKMECKTCIRTLQARGGEG